MFVHRFSGKLQLLTLALTLGLSLSLALPLTASAHTLPKQKEFFKQTNLVTDDQTVNQARFTDPNLVNAWGIVAVPDGPFWIADNGTGLSTAYDGKGNGVGSPITIPLPPNSTEDHAAPTGIVFNQTDDFVISKNGKSRPAKLLFATEDGTISGWNPKVDPTNALLKVDRSSQGAVYKGLAEGRVGSHDFLFATDFFNRQIDVFDENFVFLGSFTDTDLTNICDVPVHPDSCFSPFGIRNIEGKLFITFALQNGGGDEPNKDDLAGVGNGFVDVLDLDKHGKFVLKRFASRGQLDSPWGLEVTPCNFGKLSHVLLVGNFGHVSDDEPSILAFDIRTGKFLGPLIGTNGSPVHIDGLWGLTFGDDAKNADPKGLYFTAGPEDETHGLFGVLTRQD